MQFADYRCIVNLLHCCPVGVPEKIFKHLSPQNGNEAILDPRNGWVAAYGPWLNDDGSYKSQADRDVSWRSVLRCCWLHLGCDNGAPFSPLLPPSRLHAASGHLSMVDGPAH